MAVCTLYDFRHNKDAESYILRSCVEVFSAQKYASLYSRDKITTDIRAMLGTLVERNDIAQLIKLPEGSFGGYALLTEYKNTWTGLVEGFVYALDIEQQLLYTPLVSEFLASIRNWGKERGYNLIRVEVPEREPSQPIITYLKSLGWRTSCLIPYKIVSSPLEPFINELILHNYEEIHIRAAVEDDYPFVLQLLAEAAWSGLSLFEKSMLDCERLAKNIRLDLEPMLKERIAWSLVAETFEKRLCGHVTILEGTHNLFNIPEAELVDIFILPAYNGRRLGSKLTAHALATCLSKGTHLVSGSLVAEAASEEEVFRIRSNLEQTGWWVSSRMMYWT